ncbi:MAG: hypothetical protein J0M12_11970 [Deltaproteobacteria bacterium]|nr:hypothetical protein [Deltaproteobacteria bacterium]
MKYFALALGFLLATSINNSEANAADKKTNNSLFAISADKMAELRVAHELFKQNGEKHPVEIELPLNSGPARVATVEATSVLGSTFRAEMEIGEGKSQSRRDFTNPELKHFRGSIRPADQETPNAQEYIAFTLRSDRSGKEMLTGVASTLDTGEVLLSAQEDKGALRGNVSPKDSGNLDPDGDITDIGFELPTSALLRPAGSTAGVALRGGPAPILEIAFEADQSYVSYIGANNVQARVETLVNLINPKFQQFGLTIQISYLHLWSTADPYNVYDSQQRLNAFLGYWTQNFTNVARDHAHLLTVRSSNYYGHALYNVPCFAYSFSIDANLSVGPTTLAHEIGHTLAASHPPSCWANGISDIMCGSSTYPIANANFGLLAQNNIGNVVNSQPACFFSQGGAPYIYSGPSNVAVDAGQSARFGVAARGGAPAVYQYQWYRNGLAIAGATQSLYEITQTSMSDNGASFQVQISNTAGEVMSAVATLTVRGTAIGYKADFNHDSQLSVDDLFLFLNAWFLQSPQADFSGEGAVTIDDLFLFLNAWFAQTPA